MIFTSAARACPELKAPPVQCAVVPGMTIPAASANTWVDCELKIKMCFNENGAGSCPHGSQCRFAHTAAELGTPWSVQHAKTAYEVALVGVVEHAAQQDDILGQASDGASTVRPEAVRTITLLKEHTDMVLVEHSARQIMQEAAVRRGTSLVLPELWAASLLPSPWTRGMAQEPEPHEVHMLLRVGIDWWQCLVQCGADLSQPALWRWLAALPGEALNRRLALPDDAVIAPGDDLATLVTLAIRAHGRPKPGEQPGCELLTQLLKYARGDKQKMVNFGLVKPLHVAVST